MDRKMNLYKVKYIFDENCIQVYTYKLEICINIQYVILLLFFYKIFPKIKIKIIKLRLK